jgi:hypothetical protein
MMIPTETRDLARRLLACEAVAGKPSDPAESATFRVYEKLRRSLSALAGVAGFQALASRALTLARLEDPSLSAAQVTMDGSLQDLRELSRQIDKNQDQADEKGVLLIAQLLGLLLTFIGGTLTLRMVRDVWPEAVFDDGDSGDGRKA